MGTLQKIDEKPILPTIDRQIYDAATKAKIKDITAKELVENLSTIFRMIAMQVGYTPGKDWQVVQTMLTEIIKKHYYDMTLSDIKLSFELCVTGNLDNYLPRDSQGNPDRKCYNQFTADYFCRIMNAYKRRQNDVFSRVYESEKKPLLLTSEEKEKHDKERMEDNIKVFEKYKETGKLEFALGDEIFIYDWLRNLGYAEEIQATEEERKQAYWIYLQRAARGMVNKYQADYVRKKGIESDELDFTAFEIARRKEIKKAFDKMIAHDNENDKSRDNPNP